MSFSKKLKMLRAIKNITQDELAKAVGVKRTAIANYETNNCTPTVKRLQKIAEYFNVSTDFLIKD